MNKVKAIPTDAMGRAQSMLAHPAGRDLREVEHVECDCVPDLGPSHCHLCGDAAGKIIEWREAHTAVAVEHKVMEGEL